MDPTFSSHVPCPRLSQNPQQSTLSSSVLVLCRHPNTTSSKRQRFRLKNQFFFDWVEMASDSEQKCGGCWSWSNSSYLSSDVVLFALTNWLVQCKELSYLKIKTIFHQKKHTSCIKEDVTILFFAPDVGPQRFGRIDKKSINWTSAPQSSGPWSKHSDMSLCQRATALHAIKHKEGFPCQNFVARWNAVMSLPLFFKDWLMFTAPVSKKVPGYTLKLL